MSNFEGIPVNEMEMTIHADAADRQCENITYENWDRAMKARETTTPTAHRTAIRRLTRPVVILWVLTALVWLANALYAAGALTLIQCEIAQGALLVGVLISAVVVTVRVMGGAGNAD